MGHAYLLPNRLPVVFRGSRGLACVAACVASILLAGGGEAAAARWPGTEIRVCDHSGYAANVVEAIGWWNRVPSRVHLYRSCRAAQITIVRYFEDNQNVAGRGEYPPGGRVTLNHYWMAQLPRIQRADNVAHEIGHALGLPHLPGCALMFGGAGFGPNCSVPLDREPCGPQRHDAEALIQLYGGYLGSFQGFTCPDSLYYP
jgi:hypothetical protein